MRSQETEWQGQLLNLYLENTRINALMNPFQITNSSMRSRNQELAQQLRASQSERNQSLAD